jgi:hypothetical protein
MPSSVTPLGAGRANHRCHFRSTVQGAAPSCFHHQTLGLPSLSYAVKSATPLHPDEGK